MTTTQGWETALQFEVMEDYLRHAEHLYAVKDKKAAMQEMRQHFDKLKAFIRAEKQKSYEEGAAAGMKRTVGNIGAKLLARHSPQQILDAFFDAANEELEVNET